MHRTSKMYCVVTNNVGRINYTVPYRRSETGKNGEFLFLHHRQSLIVERIFHLKNSSVYNLRRINKWHRRTVNRSKIHVKSIVHSWREETVVTSLWIFTSREGYSRVQNRRRCGCWCWYSHLTCNQDIKQESWCTGGPRAVIIYKWR